VIDVRRHEAKLVKQLVEKVLETIPLTKYRIAIHSTNGLAQRLLDFQTKQCSTKVFRYVRSLSLHFGAARDGLMA